MRWPDEPVLCFLYTLTRSAMSTKINWQFARDTAK